MRVKGEEVAARSRGESKVESQKSKVGRARLPPRRSQRTGVDMVEWKSLHYVVDEKGRRKAVIMSYKAYLELMEDLDDLRVKMERNGETWEDAEGVLAEIEVSRTQQRREARSSNGGRQDP